MAGLIIDAFGELRDQLEQVKEDLEVSSFQVLWNIWNYVKHSLGLNL